MTYNDGHPEHWVYNQEKEVWELPIQEVKNAKNNYIDLSFLTYVKGSFICSLGFPMQFNDTDTLKMEGAIKLMEAINQSTGYLTDAENITHYDISLTDIKNVQLEMLAQYAKGHAYKQEIRKQVQNAITIQQINAIIWVDPE